uniref:(northern house mosquito) hypothetical protein n=1 Tax=Culex pipiens TaxID=7175 RepID=A0A8D8FX48_CULPI
MLLKLVIHSSFAATSFVNKQNYTQLTSRDALFFASSSSSSSSLFWVVSFSFLRCLILLRACRRDKERGSDRAWEVRFTCPVLPAGRSYPWNRRGIGCCCWSR